MPRRVAIYVRVSTQRQAQTQTIDQQLDRLRWAVLERSWSLPEDHVYRGDGYSGASLRRPGLDQLRDQAALAKPDVILTTEPDRLARNYVHQALLLEELQWHGYKVEFTDRPLSDDTQDHLLQICGVVAEYERTPIAERKRRGRLNKLQSGQLLPWTRPPYGYRADPDPPRDPAGGVLLQQVMLPWCDTVFRRSWGFLVAESGDQLSPTIGLDCAAAVRRSFLDGRSHVPRRHSPSPASVASPPATSP